MRAGGSAAGSLVALLAEIRRRANRILFDSDERAKAQRDALLSFLIRVASAGIAYLSQAILARCIGTHDYGIYVFVWTWVLVLGGLSSLGLSNTTVRLLPFYSEKGEHGMARGLMHGGRAMALFAGTIVAGVGIAAVWNFGDRLPEHTMLPAILALACVPLYAFTDVQSAIGRGRNWTAISLVPPYILRPLLILAVVAAAIGSGFPASAPTATAAALCATLMAAIAQAILVNRRVARELPAADRQNEYASWLKASLPLVAVYACELVMQNADVLTVSYVMQPSDVAIYFAAAKTMSLIMFVQYAVGSAVATRFSALHARNDRKGLEAFVGDAANWTFWPSLLGAVMILALGQPLLMIFGPEFVAGYPIMFILTVGFLVRSAMGPADILLNMLGEQRICAILLSITALLNVVLNLLLVPRLGLTGAALATSASLVAGALMSYIAARRRLNLDIAIWHHLARR